MNYIEEAMYAFQQGELRIIVDSHQVDTFLMICQNLGIKWATGNDALDCTPLALAACASSFMFAYVRHSGMMWSEMYTFNHSGRNVVSFSDIVSGKGVWFERCECVISDSDVLGILGVQREERNEKA